MEELPPSHAEAIENLKKMQHLSRLVALHAFGALSDIRLSRCKDMFDAFSFKEHAVGPSSSLFFDCDRGLLKAAVKKRT